MTLWSTPIVPSSRETRRTERQRPMRPTAPSHGADVPRHARSSVRLPLHPHRHRLHRQATGVNRHMLRLASPMQSRGEHPTFNPDGDTAPFPTLLSVLAAAQSTTRQDTSALNLHAAPEFTVRTDRPNGRLFDYHPPRGDQRNNPNATTRDGRRNRHAHRVRHSPPPRPAQPQLRPTPAPPHRGTLLPAPGYRPHTLPTTLIDYATKEAAA